MKSTAVLYHADADGFGAAYALWTVLGDSANYIPVQYGQPVPEIPVGTSKVYIVDFSYDRATCQALSEKYDLVILDHHKTAEEALNGLPFAEFDMTKSGCRMAWEHTWHSDTEVPDILRYVEDYDLWKFELPYSKEVNLYIASMPWDFKVWDKFDLHTAITAGKAIRGFRDEQIKSALKSVRMMRLEIGDGTYDVPMVNASTNISELGNVLCEAYPDAPFSVSYCDRETVRSWSLRSVGDFDVSAVAKAVGGGGHKNAAGFSTDLWWPQMHTDAFIKAFEESD